MEAPGKWMGMHWFKVSKCGIGWEEHWLHPGGWHCEEGFSVWVLLPDLWQKCLASRHLQSRRKLDPAVRVWATVHSQPWWSTPSYAFFHVSCDLMFDIKAMRLRTASNKPHSVAFSHSALQHHPRQLWRFGSWYEQHQHQGARPWHSRQGLLWSWGLPILQGQCSTCLGIFQLSSLTSFLHVLRHLKMNWMKDLYHTPYQS